MATFARLELHFFMNKRHGKLKEDNVSHNRDCLPQSILPLRPFGPAGPSPAIYRSVAWLAQGTYFDGLFSQNTGESFWDFPEHPKRALCIVLQERFGPMALSLLGRVALWDCLSGVKVPCLLQPPAEVARLFSPSPFSSRAWESAEGFDGVSLPPMVDLCLCFLSFAVKHLPLRIPTRN